MREYYILHEYLQGETVVFEGDSLDSLFIVLEGRVLQSEGGMKSYFAGDFWGLETLNTPLPVTAPYQACEDTLILRLRSGSFHSFLQSDPHLINRFKPGKDREGRLVSGFPEALWKSLKKGPGRKKGMVYFEGRTSRKSFSLFMMLPVLMILSGIYGIQYSFWFHLLSIAGFGMAGCEIFLRNMTLYKVSGSRASKKFFNWRSFRLDLEELPLDQIKSVQVNKKGTIRHLLKIGDLSIQTAGRGILFKNIDSPEKLQKKLMELSSLKAGAAAGEQRARFREILKKHFSGSGFSALQEYRGKNSRPQAAEKEGSTVFRKSGAVLFFQVFMPLSLTVLSIFPSLMMRGNPVPLLSLGLWLVRLAAGFRILWLFLDWWNDIYKIELPYIWDIERKPFARKAQKIQTDLSGILNVRVVQKGFFRILLNYGDVLVETPGNSGTLEFYSVARPRRVQTEIFRFREQLLREKEEKSRQASLKQFGEFAEIMKQLQENRPAGEIRTQQ
ncbi:MAG: cyclic nucleotide-binding domain-containing protein [Spirochaetales bacterium]|nr:cyclic nucleotide-binding domain-containing protein [Spirochaetales bacterium]